MTSLQNSRVLNVLIHQTIIASCILTHLILLLTISKAGHYLRVYEMLYTPSLQISRCQYSIDLKNNYIIKNYCHFKFKFYTKDDQQQWQVHNRDTIL